MRRFAWLTLPMLLACSSDDAAEGEGGDETGGAEGGEAAGRPGGGDGEGGQGGAGAGVAGQGIGGGEGGAAGQDGAAGQGVGGQGDPGGDGGQDGGGDGGQDLGQAVPQGYVKTCRKPCAAPEDCVPDCGDADCAADNPDGAFGPARHACEQGVCRYLGCETDEQCRLGENQQSTCKVTPAGGAFKQCRVPCIIDADCARRRDDDNGDVIDTHQNDDNWTCLEGACLYKGCSSTRECLFGRGDGFACRPVIGGVPTCFETCEGDDNSECGGGDSLFDSDNYICDGGLCIETGCVDDQECRDYFGEDDQLCR